MCHNGEGRRIRFTQSSRKHRVGRVSALFVINTVEPLVTRTSRGNEYWWEGPDERGRELEIGAVDGERDGALLVIHVMPLHYRRR